MNPAGAGKSDTPLTSSAPAAEVKGVHVPTPYVITHDFVRARCVRDDNFHDFLEIHETGAPDDKRPRFVNLAKEHGGLGLHVYDMQLPQEDLIALIAKKLAASRAAAPD